MPNRTSKTGSELFIVDNSDADWKVLRYLHDWCQISRQFDIASGYFELGALLGLKEEWQKVDKIRILMGEEVSLRTREAFAQGLRRMHHKLAPEPRSREIAQRLPARRSRGRGRHQVRQDRVPRLSQGKSSTPRPTSPTSAWRSSAPPPLWAPPTSPSPASPRTSN